MKRALISSLCAFLLSAALYLPSNCCAGEVAALADMAKNLMKKEDFGGLTSLYLYPASYSDAEQQQEQQDIAESLQFLSGEFGEVGDLLLTQENVQCFEFLITGGDVAFVKSHPNFQKFVYKSNFAKIGPGYLFVYVYENTGQPKLRGVGYGLPATPENFSAAKRIADKLKEMMQARSKELET